MVYDLEVRRDNALAEVRCLRAKEEATCQENAASLQKLDANISHLEAELRSAQECIETDEAKSAEAIKTLQCSKTQFAESLTSFQAEAAEELRNELCDELNALQKLQQRYVQDWDDTEQER